MSDSAIDMFAVLICRNSKFIRKLVNNEIGDTGLNMSHLVCMRVIDLNTGGVPASVLCETTDYDKALVSRMLGLLTDRGFVMRNPEDGSLRRGYRYVLTESGRRFNQRMGDFFEEVSHQLISCVSADEMRAFYRTSAALTDKLQELSEKNDR